MGLFFGRSGTLAPEAREERHCGTECYTDPLVRAEYKIKCRRWRVVAKTLIVEVACMRSLSGSTGAWERGGVRRGGVWYGMVGNGVGEKTSGRFMRVGRSRVRVVLFTGYARERGGGSGDAVVISRYVVGVAVEWAVWKNCGSATDNE